MSRFAKALALSAMALAVLAIALVAVFAFLRWTTSADELPGFSVEVNYPEATVSEVEQTIAVPIEQQLAGVAHLRRLRSRSWGDGSYFLEIALDRGVDLNVAQALIQERMASALAALPAQVQRQGVIVRKRSAGLLMIVGVRLTDGRNDDKFLGNYANIVLKGELARVPGVAAVVILGKQDLTLRISLDPEKLKARKLSAVDVAHALERQTAETSSAEETGPGDHPQLPADGPGKPAWRRQLEEAAIKTNPDDSVVRLRDVAQEFDLGVAPRGFASFDGQPVVALAVYPMPGARSSEVNAAVEAKIAELRNELLPPGVDAVVGFDLSQRATQNMSGNLLLDVDLPEDTPPERAASALERFVQIDPIQQTHPDALDQLRVPNNKSGMVPLREVITVRSNAEPKSLERVDLSPARSVTAEPATGLSLGECRFICEHLAAEVLPSRQPGDYRLVWLHEMPAARAPAASRPP